MSALRRDRRRGGGDGPCPTCLQLDRTCRSCLGISSYLLKQTEAGRRLGNIAAQLGLTLRRAAVLQADAWDRRDLRSYKGGPSREDLRREIHDAIAREPGLTQAEIARRMKPPMHPSDLHRAIDGAGTDRLSPELGARVMLALGRDPHALPGC